eukprot:TCONS_00038960-protein
MCLAFFSQFLPQTTSGLCLGAVLTTDWCPILTISESRLKASLEKMAKPNTQCQEVAYHWRAGDKTGTSPRFLGKVFIFLSKSISNFKPIYSLTPFYTYLSGKHFY